LEHFFDYFGPGMIRQLHEITTLKSLILLSKQSEIGTLVRTEISVIEVSIPEKFAQHTKYFE
jgi:hypothetical protein